MFKRTGSAVWKGTGTEGLGSVSTQSGALKEQPYSVRTRFVSEDGRAGTNPEELLGAAHASCFAMATSFALTGAGHPPDELRTSAQVTVEKEGAGWAVKGIHLRLEAKVPGLDPAKVREIAEAAKQGCPISKALAAVPITLEVTSL